MISIRGNAISGAILYADGTTNNTGTLSYQWKADGTDLAGENGQFYATEKSCLGKQISVTVTSSIETGELEAVMEQISGWIFLSERLKKRIRQGYLVLYGYAVFLGCVSSLTAVWELSDIWNGLMAFPNIAALLVLHKKIHWPHP